MPNFAGGGSSSSSGGVTSVAGHTGVVTLAPADVVGGLQSVKVTLSAAQIKALKGTPISCVAAQGANTLILPFMALYRYKFVSQPYGLPAVAGIQQYFDAGEPWTYAPLVGLVDQTASKSDFVAIDWSIAITDSLSVNKPLMVTHNSAGELTSGPVATSTLGAGGAGYAPGDTGEIDGGAAGKPVYEVDTVGGGGAVLTYHFTDPGTHATVGNGQATFVDTGGGDGNFTINVTAVTPGNGTMEITTYYTVVTLA